MKDKYIVKRIQQISPIEMVVTYGVYENYVVDPDGRHCDNSDFRLNLVCECKSELIAEKIAELLNIYYIFNGINNIFYDTLYL